MSKRAYPLKLPNSVKKNAAAVAENVGGFRAADTFLAERAGRARPNDLLRCLRKAPKVAPGDAGTARRR